MCKLLPHGSSSLRRLRSGFLCSLSFVLAALAPAVAEAPAPPAEESASGEATTPWREEVVVTGTRADEDTPAPHANISRAAIEENFWAQDMPALLRIAPSVHHYADAGVDLGYSYLSLRGFDQRRVAVTLNGVPLNGAQTHQVYWVDLPNFADSVEDIQVQRGVGLAFYGPGAIGGSIRLETDRLQPGEGWRAKIGAGSHGTSKVHASWTSDLSPGGWVFGASASRLATDGYRESSSSRMGMAFFTAQRLGATSNLRINVFGGREETELAYLGLTRAELAANRRANPLDEDDTFTQPHLQVIHEWRPDEQWLVENTVFAFHGRGRFDQRQPQALGFELKITDPLYADTVLAGITRERWIDEWDYGWLPRATFAHGRGTLTAGAEIRLHRGEQWGNVSAAQTEAGLAKNFRYYDYEIPKESLTLYAQYEWQASDDLTILAGLQRVRHSWELRDQLTDPVVAGGDYVRYAYDVDYSWWAPRAGVHYRFDERRSAFVSYSESRREPTSLDLYNIQEWYVSPSFGEIDLETGRLGDPIPREEKLRDYEAGFRYRGERAAFTATLYEMRFRDELVFLGGLNDIGLPVTGNSERSLHRGIELEGIWRFAPAFEVSGHLTLAKDEHLAFVENVFDDEGALVPVDRAGKRVAGFPERLGRIALAWRPAWGRVVLSALHQGRIYVDNGETRERSVDPSTVVHLDVAVPLAKRFDVPVEARLSVVNLLDREYETYGYFFGVEPTFIPAAGAQAFVTLVFAP